MILHRSVRLHTPLLLLLNVVLIPACKGERSFLRFLWPNYSKLIIWLAINVQCQLCSGASQRSFDGGGGGADSDWKGRIQVSRNHLPPNSDFSSDFAHFILEISEDLKEIANIKKIFFKNRDF